MSSETDHEFDARIEKASGIARALAPYLLRAGGIELTNAKSNVLLLRRTGDGRLTQPVPALAADASPIRSAGEAVDAYHLSVGVYSLSIEPSPDRRHFTLLADRPASGILLEISRALMIVFFPDPTTTNKFVARLSLDDGIALALALQTSVTVAVTIFE